jgi:hypothetical protein
LNVDADIPITTNDTFAADATDYIETNYSRQPTDGDMLIFTFSDLLNSEY